MISHLTIKHFRNLSQVHLSDISFPLVLAGDNAQGKTSFLEAIYALISNTLLRSKQLKEVVQDKEEFARIDAVISSMDCSLRIIKNKNRFHKLYFEQDTRVPFSRRRSTQLATFFTPDDIRLYSGPPTRRRDFLDHILSQTDRHYHSHLLVYERQLRNRNILLKSGLEKKTNDIELLDIYSAALIEHGAYLWHKRLTLFSQISLFFTHHIQTLWMHPIYPSLTYTTSFKHGLSGHSLENIQANYAKTWASYSRQETLLGRTLFGPHLDDFSPVMGNRNLAHTASRGELKSLSIATKLAEIDFYEHQLVEGRPLLLLDDIFSELDGINRTKVTQLVSRYPAIITTTERSFLDPKINNAARVYRFWRGGLIKDE